MAQIEENNCGKSKKYSKRTSVKVDLTPMVDLGFLLITFFIFTSVILQPTLTKLLLPKDSKVKTLLKDNAVLPTSSLGHPR